MSKHLFAIVLALSASFAMAKPVAELVETTGKIVLTDEKCTLFPEGFHWQAFDNDKKKTFLGCWIEDKDGIVMISEFGQGMVVPATVFKWFVNV
jgi:hypothetical protein